MYQVRSGRSPDIDDRATIVWWIPKGATAPQELLVPAPSAGHLLTLHDTYPTPEGFAVLYTRHETEHPVDQLVDSLRRFDVPQRQVTELYSQGAFEQGYREVSAGADDQRSLLSLGRSGGEARTSHVCGVGFSSIGIPTAGGQHSARQLSAHRPPEQARATGP